MRTIRFDSIGGASGDMILAALIDLGADPQVITEKLSSLGITNFLIEADRHSAGGFSGCRVRVAVTDEHGKHGRHLSEIENMIRNSVLPDRVIELSITVFRRLAEVEAVIHNTTPEKIHFHEVGAMDSIIDIVGACTALDMLGIDAVRVSALPLGTGTVECDHGTIPVPSPATVELLQGHPVIQTDERHELVTPTAAALLTTWKAQLPDPGGPAVPAGSGMGFGHADLDSRTNLLRALLLESVSSSPVEEDSACLVMECNIDDTIPELIGSLTSRLFDAGALDVFTTPIQMKKQRPGILLTVLCRPTDRESMVECIFSESTTFGIREYTTARTMLERRFEQVETEYGAVSVKIGTWKGSDIVCAPEHNDCVKRAEEHNTSVRAVYEAAMKAARS